MSQDFKKVLVKDPRLMVTDSLSYGVFKSGQNVTSAQFQAISQGNSSHTYNVQVPSEITLIDRRVMWTSTVQLKITAPAGSLAVGQSVINYGYTDSLAPFPLHNLCTTMAATINNNTVSVNIRDVLPAILRMNDKRELNAFNGTTPVAFDTYNKYSDAISTNNNPLGSYLLTSDNDLSPRGSYPVTVTTDAGSNNPCVNTALPSYVYVTFTVSEPLLLSPHTFANPKTNCQGFYGITNLNYVFNIGDCSRVWRTANPWLTAQSVQIVDFTNSQLEFTFITPQPSDLWPSRNVVPYYSLPRYFSNPQAITSGATADFQTNTLQLNSVPDKLIIMVRKRLTDQSYQDTDSFLTINSISLNWNNRSGILSSATQQQLYLMSRENGSNQTWLEFSGQANFNNNGTGSGSTIPTSGSLLILDMGKDVPLEDFYSAGSLVNANLQMKINATNYGATIANAEVVIITMNSGLFVCERGVSSVFEGILTKEQVLDASSQEGVSRHDLQRIVGGGFLDSLKSVVGKIAPVAKAVLGQVDHPLARTASSALGSLGYGKRVHKRLA